MSIKTLITSTAVSLSIAAGSLVPLSAAQADDWRHRDSQRGDRGTTAYQYVKPAPRWGRHNTYRAYAYKKHHNDRHDSRNVMIGLTALAIAAIIASSAAEREHHR